MSERTTNAPRRPSFVVGTITGMDDLEQRYLALVERIAGYPMSRRAKAVILAEIETIYRRERAAMDWLDRLAAARDAPVR